jgi:hypothetical protein
MKTFVKLSMLLGLAVASAVPAMAQVECQDPPCRLGRGASVQVDPGREGGVVVQLNPQPEVGVEGSISVDRQQGLTLIECDLVANGRPIACGGGR